MEFREQPGGGHWKANLILNGLYCEWSIIKLSERKFNVEMFAGERWFGEQDVVGSLKTAMAAADAVRLDYLNLPDSFDEEE